MTIQTTVSLQQGFGVPGELMTDSPHRAQPFTIVTTDHPEYNVMGRAFTVTDQGFATAGGTGVFAGLLVGPKEQANYGVDGNTLGATLTIANNVVGECCTMGEVIVSLPGAAGIGDLVTYDTSTGELDTVTNGSAFTGATSTTTLTVTGFTAGGAPIGIGSELSSASIAAGTVVTAFGTGTGGDGTYTINKSQTVSAEAMTATAATSNPPSGTAYVPNAVVTRYTVSGAGLAVVQLTN